MKEITHTESATSIEFRSLSISETRFQPDKDIIRQALQICSEHEQNYGTTKGVVQQRYIICIIGMLLMANAYALRNIMCLTSDVLNYGEYSEKENKTCPGKVNMSDEPLTIVTEGAFIWDKNQSKLFSFFLLGNTITQIPGGLMAERFGGKHVLGCSLLFSSVIIILTPVLLKFFKLYGGIITRFLIGCSAGLTVPALTVILAHWAPPTARATMAATMYSGDQLGLIYSTFLGTKLMQVTDNGCSIICYIFGGTGLIIYIIWVIGSYDDPAVHPFISLNEKKYLKKQLRKYVKLKKNLPRTPFKDILLSVPVWALIFAHISHGITYNIFNFYVPNYLRAFIKIPSRQRHIIYYSSHSAMIFIAIISGWIADFTTDSEVLNNEKIRKTYMAIGSIGSLAFLLIAFVTKCHKTSATIFFSLAIACSGLFQSSAGVNAVDLSPNYSGTIMGIANFFGSTTSVVSLTIMELIIIHNTTAEWKLVFLFFCLVLLISATVYLVFGKAQLLPLNYPDV